MANDAEVRARAHRQAMDEIARANEIARERREAPSPYSLEGGFGCPICGTDTPHHHTAPVVDAYQNKRAKP